MKVLAFGDSFVKMFIHCQPEVKHWKFKGKSVKGLVKEDDVERRRVQTQIRKTPSGTNILMFFGQVDFNYVRYYKIIKQQPALTEQTFEKYVRWVSSMNTRGNISIVSIFPSPIKKDKVINSLINKGSYIEEQRTVEIDNRILDEYDRSHDTWELWNYWIRYYCEKYKVGNIQLFKQDHLDPQFYDVSGLTIHLRYVPVLKLVKQYVNISIDLEKAQEIEKEYQKEKINRVANSVFRFDSLPSEGVCQKTQLPEPSLEGSGRMQIKELDKGQQQKAQLQVYAAKECLELVENKRKNTADLDTDTHLEKESQRSKQNDALHSKFSQQTLPTRARSISKQRVEEDKKKKKSKKAKNPKQKQKQKQKGKKKYVCVERIQESEDEGQRFLQLATKHRSR